MRQIFFYINILFLIFLFCACKNESINSPEILTHSQWQALNIGNYDFEQRVSCFCPPPAGRFHEITVESGAIVEIIDLEDGRSLSSENFGFFKTISQLLEFVESINPDSVAVFNIEYDSNFGFPSSLYVDFHQGIADEEIGYETRNFKGN
jgi:hypothetical protein